MLENQHSRYGAIARALPATFGKIFFVAHGEDSFAGDLLNEFPVDRDGVPRMYITVTSAATDDLAIQAALDACVANRNDYVLVLPSSDDFDMTTKLTMSKRDVHLIGMDYLSNRQDTGSNSATKIHMTGDDDAILLTGGNCEIAGFYFKNYNNQSTIMSTGSVCDCPHIHHNHFNLNATTTSGVPAIDFSTSGSSFVLIERNTFASNVSNVTFSSIISVSASCTWAKVMKNSLICGDGCTWTVGILNLGYKGQTCGNTVAAITGAGDDGTVTTGIQTAGGICNDNRLNMANTADVTADGTYDELANYSHAINHYT